MSEIMKAVVITEVNKVEVKEVVKPGIERDKVLMKVHACALCTFEQRMFTGDSHMPLPIIGGHELVGEIAEVGDRVNEKEFPVGKKIAARLIHSCGKCYFCRRGEENLCTEINSQGTKYETTDGSGRILSIGGLSQYVLIDPSQIYDIDQDLADTQACFAEPLACVLNSIERGRIELGDDVVVIGGGIMGMLHVMAAKLSGARVIMSEPDEVRRKIAEELGCDITFSPMEKDPVKFVQSLTDGRGAEVVFNTTPIAAVAAQAIQMVAPMGRVVMYSSQHPDKPIEVSPNWLHNTEAVITGAVSPSVRSFNRSVNLLTKKLIDPSKLMSGEFGMDEAQAAFEAASRPDTFRCIIKF
ncbi:MAG: alcohol dehydrogenase catalytic domain-containing protein [Lachnospiraceae bacterium]|nr:alcohol dehydrogenase catalytic domain-containing protein [Lachnospiraceae bacterium]